MAQVEEPAHEEEEYDTMGVPPEDNTSMPPTIEVEVVVPPQAKKQPAAAKAEAVNLQPTTAKTQDPPPVVAKVVEQPESQEKEPLVVKVLAEETVVGVPPVIVDISSLLGTLTVTFVRSTL